jgi:hypothetical protein
MAANLQLRTSGIHSLADTSNREYAVNRSNETAHPPRRIFDRAPSSWRALQSHVAQVFSECGCEASCGVTVNLPRGRVELDVVVRDPFATPHSNYICECKNWARPVSRSTVHGFRTVVTELGANRGLLISRNGFQAGAREAAQFTNIDLLSWSEFEDLMFNRWIAGITRRLDPLFASAYELMGDDDNLWKLRECTEETWNERGATVPALHAYSHLGALFVALAGRVHRDSFTPTHQPRSERS